MAAVQADVADERGPGGPGTVERERILLLEVRLEQMRSALDAARADADRARARLAEAAAREAGHARRLSLLQEELADARAEIVSLNRRLDRSEALRAELEGHLHEAGARADAEELEWLRREAMVARERVLQRDRALEHLRARVEELLASRDTLLARVSEWQRLVREDGPEAADLAEFIAELRRDVLELERRQVLGEERELELRERLARAGLAPEGDEPPGLGGHEPPTDRTAGVTPAGERPPPAPVPDAEEPTASLRNGPDPGAPGPKGKAARLAVSLDAAEDTALQAKLLVLLGRTADREALRPVERRLLAREPSVRAAAYEALGRLLEDRAGELEPYLREGLADPEARVRRRVVLAAAGARGTRLRELLAPLRDDPDAGVRRVAREALRHAPASAPRAGAEGADAGALTRAPA